MRLFSLQVWLCVRRKFRRVHFPEKFYNCIAPRAFGGEKKYFVRHYRHLEKLKIVSKMLLSIALTLTVADGLLGLVETNNNYN